MSLVGNTSRVKKQIGTVQKNKTKIVIKDMIAMGSPEKRIMEAAKATLRSSSRKI